MNKVIYHQCQPREPLSGTLRSPCLYLLQSQPGWWSWGLRCTWRLILWSGSLCLWAGLPLVPVLMIILSSCLYADVVMGKQKGKLSHLCNTRKVHQREVHNMWWENFKVNGLITDSLGKRKTVLSFSHKLMLLWRLTQTFRSMVTFQDHLVSVWLSFLCLATVDSIS